MYIHTFHAPSDHQSISNNNIKAIFKDSNEEVWIGTDKGLNKVLQDKKGNIKAFIKYGMNEGLSIETIRYITEDSEKNFWIATWGGGVNVFDLETEHVKTYSSKFNIKAGLASSVVWQIYHDQSNRIWVVTSRDISVYNKNTDTFTTFSHRADDPNSLSNSHPICITESQGSIWVGTNGAGINRLDPITMEFHRIQENENLRGASIYSIIADKKGILWMSTNDGIVNYDPATQKTKKI